VGAVGISPALRAAVYAQGSDAPEKKEVKIGFIPLTDCASVVMASVLGFDKKYGVKIIPTKEASWAGVRDKLVNGELDFAHVLYGLVYGVHWARRPQEGHGRADDLNHNGQAITLSKKLADKGAVDGAGLAKLMAGREARIHLRQTFPTGTHAMWLYYWLASATASTRCQGRQGHHRAAAADGGQHARGQHGRLLRGRALEPPRHHGRHRHHRHHHPGHLEGPPRKGAGHHGRVRQEVPQHRARRDDGHSRGRPWIDAGLQNKNKMAETVADKSYVNTSVDAINQRILGRYQNGLGKTWDDPNHMKFFNDGAVNFPYLSDGMWFLTQHKRWGLLKDHPDYLAVAKQINQIDLYKQAATAAKSRAQGPDAQQQADRRRGLGRQGPEAKYADGFKIKAPARSRSATPFDWRGLWHARCCRPCWAGPAGRYLGAGEHQHGQQHPHPAGRPSSRR
jgi:nitrate/nitrite transport system substrate-binding protein